MLFLAIALLAMYLLMAGKPTRTPAAPDEARVLTSVPLTGAGVEAGQNAPLFKLKDMAPGRRYERCIVIAADSAGSVVRFAVGGVSGTLTPWLRVEGTTGTGTSRTCDDFVSEGTAFYNGSLAALNSGGAEGVPTGWVPSGPERRTFRLAVQVADDNRAAGAHTVATLTWRLQEPQAVPSTAPVTRSPVGPGTPAVKPSATPSITTSATTAPMASSAPSGPAASPTPSTSIASCVPSTTAQIGKLLAGVAPVSWLALLLLLLVVLFLAIQDRLDRRDPKLAHAPLRGDPDQAFPDNGSTPWRTP